LFYLISLGVTINPQRAEKFGFEYAEIFGFKYAEIFGFEYAEIFIFEDH
jgi:hypothetical protein